MKSTMTLTTASCLLAAVALAQPARYTIRDLGTLPGGSFSQATYINNRGVITGVSDVADGTQHSVIWYKGWIGDLSENALGGPNSEVFGINEKGQVLGQAESSSQDPNNENFCGYGTGLRCLPFLWQDGVTTPLPTLGGPNGSVGQINQRGEASGYAENGVHDPDCASRPESNGMGPQAVDFQPVIWGPEPGRIRPLALLPGDTVGISIGINDSGQAVGATGTCATVVLPPLPAVGSHAVLWDKDGSVHDLGTLGGTTTATAPAHGNIALSINNQGQIVGASLVADNTNVHPFLWTKEEGMRDLGTLPGDVSGAGLDINAAGAVVGPSVDEKGDLRAFVWQNGAMSDLNDLVPADFPLFLLLAVSINNHGDIVGFGVQKDEPHAIHAFLAAPDHGAIAAGESIVSAAPERIGERRNIALPENVRTVIRQRLAFGRIVAQPVRPQ